MSNSETCLIDGELTSKQHALMGLAIGAFTKSEMCSQVSSLNKNV